MDEPLCPASTSANCLQIAKMDVGRDPARDHLAETTMVEAVACMVGEALQISEAVRYMIP